MSPIEQVLAAQGEAIAAEQEREAAIASSRSALEARMAGPAATVRRDLAETQAKVATLARSRSSMDPAEWREQWAAETQRNAAALNRAAEVERYFNREVAVAEARLRVANARFVKSRAELSKILRGWRGVESPEDLAAWLDVGHRLVADAEDRRAQAVDAGRLSSEQLRPFDEAVRLAIAERDAIREAHDAACARGLPVEAAGEPISI